MMKMQIALCLHICVFVCARCCVTVGCGAVVVVGASLTVVVGAGDSAGGALTVMLMASLTDQNLPMPAGGMLYSPWVLSCR